jgi:dTDP-4-dehydrorhamnose 3,5-epimerase
MKVRRLDLGDVLVVEPDVFGDPRGFFLESYNRREFLAAGLDSAFVQDNHSRSARGVLRGLHYQLPPKAQGKLVRVSAGTVCDVAVDVRRGSPTFGRWVAEVLSAENHLQMWIPPGFAHGFLVLSEFADFLYKTTDYYSREHERVVAWNDPDIGIAWDVPTGGPIVSDRDRQAPRLRQLTSSDLFPPPSPGVVSLE